MSRELHCEVFPGSGSQAEDTALMAWEHGGVDAERSAASVQQLRKVGKFYFAKSRRGVPDLVQYVRK